MRMRLTSMTSLGRVQGRGQIKHECGHVRSLPHAMRHCSPAISVQVPLNGNDCRGSVLAPLMLCVMRRLRLGHEIGGVVCGVTG